MKNLKYRIYSVSSQEQEEHQAWNLTQSNEGWWQSAQCCSYPQQMTVQFFVPIRTKNMKMTFHQYKIPKMVEIFIKCAKNEQYRKLGYVQPSDNSQSDYLDRQIKTIFFEFPLCIVKLVFHQNYKNEMNLFDQVALCDLTFEGEILSASQFNDVQFSVVDSLDTEDENEEEPVHPQLQKNQSRPSNNSFKSALFPDVFSALEEAKKEAVNREDFQQASNIKYAILSFKELETQIIKLENEKKKALEEEDYDKCHKLKIQINRKKDMTQRQITEFLGKLSGGGSPMMTSLPVTNVPPIKASYVANKVQEDNIPIYSPSTSREAQQEYMNEYESQIVPALRNKNKNKGGQEEFPPSISRVNQSLEEDVHIYNPSTAKKSELDENMYESVDQNSQLRQMTPLQKYEELEELDLKISLKIKQYFQYISELHWRMVYSKKYWKAKVDALQEVLSYSITTKNHVLALFELLAVAFQDKHTVTQKYSLMLLQRIIQVKEIKFSLNHTPYYIESILNALINLMNQTSQQLKKQAVAIYINMPQISIIHLGTVIHTLIKHGSQVTHNKLKMKSNPKLTLTKIGVMQGLVRQWLDSEHHFDQIAKWAVSFLDDPNNAVRNSSSNILIEIASRGGEDLVIKHVQDLKKQEVFDNFLVALNNSIEVSKMENVDRREINTDRSEYKQKQRKKKQKRNSRVDGEPDDENLRKIQESPIPSPEKIKESEDVELAYSQQSLFHENSQSHDWFANSKQNEIKVMELDQQEDDYCDYCFQSLGKQSYNKHLLHYCPVVIKCEGCNAMIFLRELTFHLLEHCKVSHKQCPRCKLAIEIEEINQHIAQEICSKKRKGWEKCQLCEADIQPDDQAWVDHSLKCPYIKPKQCPLDEGQDSA